MDKIIESCPWCHKEVKVEAGRECRYTCSKCNKDFTYTPDFAGPKVEPPVQPAKVVTAPPSDFVETPAVKDLVDRTLAYIKDGLHVHLCGPAGSGKTTLALHVAGLLDRQVVLIHGDDEMGTADLVGKESGYKRSYTHDNYVHTVLKVDEEMKPMWVGRALTDACESGCTVVYDEFTRSRPEANNVLLSVLEELRAAIARQERACSSRFPNSLHQQSRGVCGGPRRPGRSSGPDGHNSGERLRPGDRGSHHPRAIRTSAGGSREDHRPDPAPFAMRD